MALSNTRTLIISCFFLLTLHSYSLSYRAKYADVLKNYSIHIGDSLKYKAALYLIDNMGKHASPEGKGIECYLEAMQQCKPYTDIGRLGKLWRDCHHNAETEMMPDSSVVTPKQLIENIDDAFDMWQYAPWFQEVSFDLFLEYILPYRVSNEHYSPSWRSNLRKVYQVKIMGITDVKVAFTILRREVLSRISNSNSFTPYNLDVNSYEHICRANCNQRCILLASVLRAFAIPAAMDVVPLWADYSTKGHTWISLVLEDGTYTVFGDDDTPRKYNKIDASVFLNDNGILDALKLPLQIKKEKRVAKIFRNGFARPNQDVSCNYGLDGHLSVFCKNSDVVYLCTYQTGKDWLPIVQTKVIHDTAVFDNLGKGVVYLPVIKRANRYLPLYSPIRLDENGKVHEYPMTNTDTCTISVNRKYPLCSYMPVQWQKLIGSTIEGADNPNFTDADTLAMIMKLPLGQTNISLNPSHHYRYVRFKTPINEIALLAELLFLDSEGNTIDNRYLSAKVDTNRMAFLFDGDKETRIKALSSGYWVGVDLGPNEKRSVSKVSFAPVSDGNDIQSGHLYELYGFDTSWHLLGRRYVREEQQLVFSGVPRGMLLLLKDKTKGHEERIFEYKEGKQIWY